MANIQFGNRMIRNGESIDRETVRGPISIQIAGNSYDDHMIVLYDLDTLNGTYVHFYEIAIPGTDLSKGHIVQPYLPIDPLSESGTHRYILDVYRVDSFGATPIDRTYFTVPTGTGYSNAYGEVDKDQKYCDCIVKVTAKQPRACNTEKAWFGTRDGKKCYDPYAVCHASVKGESGRPECLAYYKFPDMTDDELIGFSDLRGVQIPEPYNRQATIYALEAWRQQKL